MSSTAPNLIVCTVTYNNPPHELAKFAHSYVNASAKAKQAGLSVELLYRDNGFASGLSERISDARAVDLPGDDQERNIGYGPAMHALWAQAFDTGTSAVITANPDGAFHPECIVRLHRAAQLQMGQLVEARQFPSEHAKQYDANTHLTDWASGCCVYVSRLLYESVGNIDSNFWLYMEDVDYSWRVRAAGHKIFVCPTALYGHDTVQRQLSARAHQEMLLAGRRLGWKWGSTTFVQQCESSLLRHYPHLTLPSLGPMPALAATHQRIACFDRLFAFAPTRWTL